MKKVTRILSVLLICVIVLTAFSGCSNDEIKAMLNQFETSCQKLDVREMLSCFDPAVSDPVLSLMTVFGISDTSDLLGHVTSLLNNFGTLGVSAEEFFSSIRLSTKTFEYSKDRTSCDVTVVITYGDQRAVEAIFSCIKTQGKWFISDITF